MVADIAIKGDVSEEREQSKLICSAEPRNRGCDAINADIDVIKHRIYEVRGLNWKSQIVTSSPGISNTENNTQFAIKNFDRKIMKETEQDAKMAA